MSKYRSESHGPRESGRTPIHVTEREVVHEDGRTVVTRNDSDYVQIACLPREQVGETTVRTDTYEKKS